MYDLLVEIFVVRNFCKFHGFEGLSWKLIPQCIIDKSFNKISPVRFFVIDLFAKNVPAKICTLWNFSYSQKSVTTIHIITGVLNNSYLKRCINWTIEYTENAQKRAFPEDAPGKVRK